VPCIYRGPLFFLGYRGQGYVEALESYIEKLAARDRVPEALLRLVGREENPTNQAASDAAATSETSIELLLTKHANPEQRRVIEELETKAIANLIGHLLAKRQRILLTSHASKALRVVKEHVAPSLRPLRCAFMHVNYKGGSG
jgi:predicted transcriptional regulator